MKKPNCTVKQGFDTESFTNFYYVSVKIQGKKPAILIDKEQMCVYKDKTEAELVAHNIEKKLRDKYESKA